MTIEELIKSINTNDIENDERKRQSLISELSEKTKELNKILKKSSSNNKNEKQKEIKIIKDQINGIKQSKLLITNDIYIYLNEKLQKIYEAISLIERNLFNLKLNEFNTKDKSEHIDEFINKSKLDMINII